MVVARFVLNSCSPLCPAEAVPLHEHRLLQLPGGMERDPVHVTNIGQSTCLPLPLPTGGTRTIGGARLKGLNHLSFILALVILP